MKKALLVAAILLISFTAFSMQQTYRASDYEYQQVYALCRMAGVETKQMVAPVSADQLLEVLKTIPYSALTSEEKTVYDNLVQHLREPYMVYNVGDNGFDFTFAAAPDVFIHSSKQEVSPSETIEPKRDILPFLEISGEAYFSQYAYGKFNFSFVERTTNRDKAVSFNLDPDGLMADNSSPYEALVSVGTKGFNLTVGRDQLSYGRGQTGNLVLGDNFWFEDFAKISYLKGMFAYNFTLITFDNNSKHGSSYNPLMLDEFDFNSPHQMVVLHQMSFQPFKWFNLSMSEGMLQYGSHLFGDLSILSPFMLLHNVNSYMTGSANNFFGLDFSVTPAKGWQINVNLFFDQIQQPHEVEGVSTVSPDAYAFLANGIYSRAIAGGVADFYVEAAYTNRAVYLKESFNPYGSKYKYWDVDLIVGNATTSRHEADINYLGYKYGPDTVAFGTGVKYSKATLKLSLDILFKIHGDHGMKRFGYSNQQDYVEEESTDTFNRFMWPTFTEGKTSPEKRLSVIAKAEYSPFDWLTVQSSAGVITAWHFHNSLERKPYCDLEMTIGMKINATHLLTDVVKARFAK